jgi:CubicO group peptidase (beta-lactamase class C family)
MPLDLVNLAVAGAPPASPPGTARTYTDTDFVLAGLIIASLARRPLHEAYRDLALDPAGMTDTWLESSSETPAAATSRPTTSRGTTSRTWIRRSIGLAVDWSAPQLTSLRSSERSPGASC